MDNANYSTNSTNILNLVESCLKYIPTDKDKNTLINKTTKLINSYERALADQNKSKIQRTNDDLYRLVKNISRFLNDHQINATGSYLIKDSEQYPEIKIADNITTKLIKEYSTIRSLEKLVD